MKGNGSRPRAARDPDGVRVESRRGLWPMIAAIGLAALVVFVVMIRIALRLDEGGDVATDQPRRRIERAASPRRTPAMQLIPVRRDAVRPRAPAAVAKGDGPAETPPADTPEAEAPTPLAKPMLEPGWEATQEEPVVTEEDLNRPTPPPSDYGWKGPGGLALFPAPGTNPPKAGVVVPEGVELPAGYMRHYQTTDDGKQLEPILTFDPDYEFFDAEGNRVTIPADNVVPPELVPAGIPIEILEVPEPDYGGPSHEEMQQFLSEHPELLTEGTSEEDIRRALEKYQGGKSTGTR